MEQNEEIMYMVLKINRTVNLNEKEIEVEGVEGYIPVFKTLEKAKEKAQNGKYRISQIRIVE